MGLALVPSRAVLSRGVCWARLGFSSQLFGYFWPGWGLSAQLVSVGESVLALSAAELPGWLCPNTGLLLGDQGLQLPSSQAGGQVWLPQHPSISCTSDTPDQGAAPCQGEEIWGSLSCTRCSQGSAGSQGSGTEVPCHTEVPTATKCHYQQTPIVTTHSGLGQWE